jgi:hypothetical protein
MSPKTGRLARLAILGTTLALALALAQPGVRAARAGGCEPVSWQDWHLAMRRQCLTPGYVCQNMTTPGMLADPDVAAGYRQALSRGVDGYDALAEVVGQMRETFGGGCRAARPARETGRRGRAAPAGHAGRRRAPWAPGRPAGTPAGPPAGHLRPAARRDAVAWARAPGGHPGADRRERW